jgi:hypothetical protein
MSLQKSGTSDNNIVSLIHDVQSVTVYGHNPATKRSKSRPNLTRQMHMGRIKKTGWPMQTNDKPGWIEREREEIAARVAHFRATQKKFEKEREEYYAATLSNAWDGFKRPGFWS